MFLFSLFSFDPNVYLHLDSKAHRFVSKILFYAIPLFFAILFAFTCTSEFYFEELKSNLFDLKAILVLDNGFEILTYFCKCLTVVFVMGAIVFFLLSLPLRVFKRKMIEIGFSEVTFTFGIISVYAVLLMWVIYLIGIYIHF